MSRHSRGVLTGVGSAILPLISIYAGANGGGTIREIGLFNNTSVAVDVVLRRLTTAGTKPAALTEQKQQPNAGPALCTVHSTHTVGPTLPAGDLGYRASLGAAIGAAVIWTFGDDGLVLTVGVVNGIGVLIENGSGQPIQGYIVWDE